VVFIGISVTKESLEFLASLNNELNYKMKYSIEKLPSNIYFVKLYSRDWDVIINQFIPYFNKTYGDKFKGLKRLEKLHSLLMEYKNLCKQGEIGKINDLIEKIILLGYNLIDFSKRKTSIEELLVFYNIKRNLTVNFFEVCDNTEIINKYFLLGLILGYGNIYIRIRKSNNLPWFSPSVRIVQKITEDNYRILTNIKLALTDSDIVSNITLHGHLYVWSVNSIVNVDKLIKWLPDDSYFWYWRKEKYLIFRKALLLLSLKANNWCKSKELILNLIYKISIYKISIYYWLKLVTAYYTKNIERKDLYYISIYKDRAWSVKLPIDSKPNTKYFFFKTSGSKEKALIEAKKYRDEKLNIWIKENKLNE
jgi:hypothetical protein